MITELVKFKNSSGLYLDGLYFHDPTSRCCIIHVHGSFGNFYSNQFIKIMADIYNTQGINFLSFNLTQHDGIAEAVREDRGEFNWEYVGYSVSTYETCIDDINGALEFAKGRNNEIVILQGHSLGCNRVLYYEMVTHCGHPVILLSPTNSSELQRRWIFPETIEHQMKRLQTDELFNVINYKEHGVYTIDKEVDGVRDDVPCIPITGKALYSIITNPSFDFLRMLDQEELVSNDAFVYMGEQDEYQTEPLSRYKDCFDRYFSHVTYKQIKDGNHSFKGHEEELAKSIAKWVKDSF